MARVTTATARKIWKCGKCGEEIKIGDTYHWAHPRYRAKVIRCEKCGRPKHSELTSSEYIRQIEEITEGFNTNTITSVDDVEGTIDSLVSELESLRDEQQERLDNMPEQLQESSSSGEMLRERIDNLESAISDLESIDTAFDVDDVDTDEDTTEEEKDEAISEAETEWIDEKQGEIEDALSNLS